MTPSWAHPRYVASPVDGLGPPAAFDSEERYLGYREADWSKPFARYFQAAPLPPQPHVMAAVHSGAVPPNRIVTVDRAAEEMSKGGYSALETGYGTGPDGSGCVACLTDMPEVEPVMWQWWFGWHMAESARYKLWHPSAHVFTAPGEQRSDQPGLPDPQKYVGNVSYIDEYIGTRLMRLAVRFVAPASLGFGADSADCVTIVARGGPSVAPVTAVWLIHQVRRTAKGSEMRSRFYLGAPEPLPGMAARGPPPPGVAPPEPAPADLLEHCGTEMNHLASFLPELHSEFSGRS